jgi:ribosomal protein S18 acetylase RimI-like enzyme
LRTLSVGDPSFRERQLERLSRFGASYAYAVFVDGQIAHVSWLLPPVAMNRDIPAVLKAREDEAEITCCETLPAFRGRGIYGIAIRNLFEVARGQGVRRIFMKTAPDNKASQSGIEKVGLKRLGSAILVWLPVTQRLVVWRRFWGMAM